MANKATLDISSWNLAKLTITVPPNGTESVPLQVRATTTERNGSTASTTQAITLHVLTGNACATPVGVNPYVNYVSDVSDANAAHSLTTTHGLPSATLSVSALQPEHAPIVLPCPTASTAHTPDLDDWLATLGQVIGENVKRAVEKAWRGGRE